MDDTYIYKNTGKQPLTFMNVGVVKPGKTVKSPVELNHPDMKLTTITKANDEDATDSAPVADKEQADAEESTK